jgi:Flp pilus assembly protein TadB
MPQWAGIISLVACFGRPAGARFLVDSGDVLLWVLGVALIIAGAWLGAFFELRRHSRQAAAEVSTRIEPRLGDKAIHKALTNGVDLSRRSRGLLGRPQHLARR